MKKIKILFLCTGNSCRSQMAEGFVRALKSDQIEAYSAGVNPEKIDPRAIKAMAEIGIDISYQKPKSVEGFIDDEFDYVITLCDELAENCPVFLGKAKKRVHYSFADPPILAKNARSEEEAMSYYRKVRDEIKEFVMGIPSNLL